MLVECVIEYHTSTRGPCELIKELIWITLRAAEYGRATKHQKDDSALQAIGRYQEQGCKVQSIMPWRNTFRSEF
jgi:hypothetical protein